MNQFTSWLIGVVLAVSLCDPLFAQSPASDFAADRAPNAAPVRAASLLLPVPTVPTDPHEGTKEQPKAPSNALPIDLATALRLAHASSPTIAIAQTRVREALANLDQANALWLPTISGGAIYFRHDGIDENRKAELFTISRGSLFAGGGAAIRLDLADAIYQPLAARQLAQAQAATARAITNNSLLEVVSAYFDLVQAYAQVAINADILSRDEEVLKAAESGARAGLLRSAADVNRARTEVALRRIEKQELLARRDVASARLSKLLILDPAVTLIPADEAAIPIDLLPPEVTLQSLIEQAVRNRPELVAAVLQQEAAETRARQARYSPFIPRFQAQYLGGGFGGGKNGTISNPEGYSDVSAQMFWELRGLGFGNLADMRLRDAERDRASLTVVAARAQVASEVVEALRAVEARRASLDEARTGDKEAREMYRKLSATSFGMVGPKGQFDALEPLLAVQALNQARLQLLAATTEYNRSQMRLLTAIGQPAVSSFEPKPVPVLPNPAGDIVPPKP